MHACVHVPSPCLLLVPCMLVLLTVFSLCIPLLPFSVLIPYTPPYPHPVLVTAGSPKACHEQPHRHACPQLCSPQGPRWGRPARVPGGSRQAQIWLHVQGVYSTLTTACFSTTQHSCKHFERTQHVCVPVGWFIHPSNCTYSTYVCENRFSVFEIQVGNAMWSLYFTNFKWPKLGRTSDSGQSFYDGSRLDQSSSEVMELQICTWCCGLKWPWSKTTILTYICETNIVWYQCMWLNMGSR